MDALDESFDNLKNIAEKYPTEDMIRDGVINKLILSKATMPLTTLKNPLSVSKGIGCVDISYTPVLTEVTLDDKTYDLPTILKPALSGVTAMPLTGDVDVVPDKPLGDAPALDTELFDNVPFATIDITSQLISKKISDYNNIIKDFYTKEVKNAGSDKIRNAIMNLHLIYHTALLTAAIGILSKYSLLLTDIGKNQKTLLELYKQMDKAMLDLI